MSKESSNAEARKRVDRALNKIEDAQNLLGEACGILSRLIGAVPEWKAVSDHYDETKALWYAIQPLASSTRIVMDSPGPWTGTVIHRPEGE